MVAIEWALAYAVSRAATSLAPSALAGDWAKLDTAQTDSRHASKSDFFMMFPLSLSTVPSSLIARQDLRLTIGRQRELTPYREDGMTDHKVQKRVLVAT